MFFIIRNVPLSGHSSFRIQLHVFSLFLSSFSYSILLLLLLIIDVLGQLQIIFTESLLNRGVVQSV